MKKIRKQVYDLTPADLKKYPVWEFALDEEGEEEQDEATVRPYTESDSPDPGEGMFLVRGRFTLSDGTSFIGYLTPTEESSDLGIVQPQIVTERGQVGFWSGTLPPDLKSSYAILGKTAAETFPIHFISEVEIAGIKLTGTIPAFLKLKDIKTMKVVELK